MMWRTLVTILLGASLGCQSAPPQRVAHKPPAPLVTVSPLTPAANAPAREPPKTVDKCSRQPIEFCGETWSPTTTEISCYEGRGSDSAMDLKPLACLPSLRKLELVSGEIEFILTLPLKSLKPLAGLRELRSLGLGHSTVDDLRPLAGLQQLEELTLHANPLEDLAPLAGLHRLQVLDLSCTSVVDLGPLAGLSGLRQLNVAGTSVQDLQALEGLLELERLSLPKRNPVRPARVQALQAALPDLTISYGSRCCDG